jgi:hypothetical protein
VGAIFDGKKGKRADDTPANELAKIASGRITVPPNIFARDVAQPSVTLESHP